jgi:hypothetical protein
MPFWAVLLAIGIPAGLIAAVLVLENRVPYLSRRRRQLWLVCAGLQLLQVAAGYWSRDMVRLGFASSVLGLAFAVAMAIFDRPPDDGVPSG